MAYKALYRKYRPETFDNVVGQKHIIKTLQNAISTNKVAHAYIFSGPRGTGKTTMAKILAKAVNCTGEGNKPCNCCPNCIAINEGSHPDIVEIDAASNNGVDEVRELIEKVKYAPIQGKYKVYIIDEVHMMTPGAFNALLKTLEEPPEHVIFILATTDVHKVIPTVLSRCQRFDFSKIDYNDIKERIEYILNKENITYENEVLSLIAELADGGMRDALSILDQVVSYAGNDIKLQHVYDIYGMMSSKDMVEYLTLLAEGKTKDVLNMVENYIGRGIDVKRVTYDLMVCLKDAIVFSQTSDASLLERLNADYAKAILRYYSIDNALKVTEILNEARNNYRLSTNYRLFFELASLKIIETLSSSKTIFKEVIVESAKPAETPKEEVKVPEAKEEAKPSEIKEEPKPAEEAKPEEAKPEEVKPQEIKVVETPKEPEVKKEESVPDTSDNVRGIKEAIKKNDVIFQAPPESEKIEYSDEEYINIMGQGDKRFKEYLNENWKKVKENIDNPQKRYVSTLLDATVGVANKNFVMLKYEYPLYLMKAKQRNNIILIRKYLKEIFGYEFEVYAVDNQKFIDLARKYFELRTAGKLPKVHDIPHVSEQEPEMIVAESEEITDATIELGKDLFGNDLKIE